MHAVRSARIARGFPCARIELAHGGAPIEVHLIGQLGHGQGDALIAGSGHLQRDYPGFVDELDEPSARIGDLQPARGDRSSLYTFSVGRNGHPFHRHAGPRVFTAISGSSGALLRFSNATRPLDEFDSAAFLASIRQVGIPPDSLFTARFGGGVWHQFLPADGAVDHPALFAVSCHTDETAGIEDATLLARVNENEVTIPGLTELLPSTLMQHLAAQPAESLPTIELRLQPIDNTSLVNICRHIRGAAGRLRSMLVSLWPLRGFTSIHGSTPEVLVSHTVPHGSLLAAQLGGCHGHDDTFRIEVPEVQVGSDSAAALLASLLQGFLTHRPITVSGLMRLRNALVMPLGLRRSALGCPVSSLLSKATECRFAGEFPVLDQSIAADGRKAEVLLGADDRHLQFRSSVSVERRRDGIVVFQLASRVAPKNGFGRIYMKAISTTHRKLIGPMLLRGALANVLVSSPLGWSASALVRGVED